VSRNNLCVIGTKVRRAHPLGLNLIELLELRRLLTTFTVTSNSDSPLALGTLRQVIVLANMIPGADTIAFNIMGTPTIHPLTALPAVTGPTTIDGTSQPGCAAGHPVVFIEGTSTSPEVLTANADGLRITGAGSSFDSIGSRDFADEEFIDTGLINGVTYLY
jgi:hypothetical protein